MSRRRFVPLSFAQERLWSHDRWQPDSALFNLPAALRLTGRLDAAALAGALREIARRHEVLRTVYETTDGGPVQGVRSDLAPPLPMVDLTRLAMPRRRGEAERLAQREARQPFDLTRGPAVRTSLLRLAPTEHTVHLTFHHIAADAWSIRVFLGELTALYARTAPLPELPMQYADFAARQRQWLASAEAEAQLASWREQLAGLPALELPGDRPRPAVRSLRGAVERFRLPAPHLQELGRRHGTTELMTLLAAFQVLLRRHTGQRDLAIGSPAAGRTPAELAPLVGRFANILVLRCDLSADPEPTCRELLDRTRGVVLAAQARQDLPFERLVEELDPAADPRRNPLVQVLFALRAAPAAIRELAPGLGLRLSTTPTRETRFDLSLILEKDDQGFRGEAEYAADLYDAPTIRRLTGHLATVLQGLIADPERRLSELPLLPAAERHQLLYEWNRSPGDELGAVPFDLEDVPFDLEDVPFDLEDVRFHELFAARAARWPDAVAVVSAQGQLSYGELDRRANQLAAHLRTLGVGPEVFAGLLIERSPEALVGIFGVLKAGGAYLPLDPAYPRERLAYMLEDAGRVAVVLTREGLAAQLPAGGSQIVRLDADWPTISSQSPEDAAAPGRAENPAYLIYTSGSTGRPKGVILSHRGLCRLAAAQIRYYAIGSSSRVVQFSSLSFDASVYEIFSTLLGGGKLCLGKAGELLPGAELHRFLNRHAVSHWTVVPSVVRAMPDDELPALDWLTVAGEACPPELVGRWAPGRCFVNAYGPTESTVCASAARVREGRGEKPPIGRPFAASRLYVADHGLDPVPIGVSGELLIGGAGLARGYLGRPGQTAARFVPNPWASGGERLYRSGDLVRLRTDGELEFLGRIDHQVKVRGFRIELGEVEAALGRYPGVQAAAVVVREDAPTVRRLVAFVVREEKEEKEEKGPDADQLRAHLGESLPEYMVPQAVVFLESLPLGPSGKVDRAALGRQPVPTEPAGPRAAPRNPIEELLAEIFAQLLGTAGRPGIHDDFFELGGHSLLATQVQSRLRRELGVELPIHLLFERPTVAGVAAAAAAALRREERPEIPPLEPGQRPGPAVPLSFAQQRLWFLDRFAPDSPLYNIPVGLRLTGRLDPRKLVRALDEIVRRHEVLRTIFETVDGEPVQVIPPARGVPLPVVDLDRLRAPARQAEARRLALAEARRPFDLARGPVARAVLLRLAPNRTEHDLLFTVHHIAFDGWSAGVFLHELAAGYRGDGLPEPSIQYADFAVWQRQWLDREVLERQLAYWRQQLAGLPVVELPCDRPRPAVQSFRGGTETMRLPELGGQVEELSRRSGTTLFMTLLAAFQLLLQRYSGQEDLAVGSPIANRNHAETEGLLGFFVNTLALRGDLRGDPTFAELLARVRGIALGAYAHQDLPFEKLVEELAPDRNLSHSPLVQVMFVLQNAPMATRELAPGLGVGIRLVPTGLAKFELTVTLEQDEGGLSGTLEYNTDLFDASTIRRLAGHLETLLKGVVSDPERRISELPLLPPAERCQLLLEWSGAEVPYPADVSVHQLFEAQAAATPEAVAVVFAGRSPAQQVSYAELNRRANRLAHRLRAEGVGPEVCVGLCVERSVEMVVGILGILKAGGAYLPLDPSYPRERLAFMLEDAAAPVLVVEERLAERLSIPEGSPRRLLLPDEDRAAAARHVPENPDSGATAENLAYVMYTSGSTGRPKGVGAVHRGVVRLVRGANYAALDAGQVFLQLAPIAFDASTLEIWGALVNGGRLVVFPPHPPALEELGAVLERCAVTTLWLTAGLFHQMVDERPQGLRAVRQLLAGGDVLSAAHVRRALAELPDAVVINGYGPTENTTFTCCSPMRRAGEVGDPVAIGRPIAGTRVHVLDRRLRPVGIGIPGELLTAGAGLARGYLNRPQPTAESFVPSPLGAASQRLYRTGDVVRLLADGRIEFLGRRDFQVKVRGFRIELGEVEGAVVRHPAVREAAVVVAGAAGGEDQRLVAYLVAAESPPEVATLRGFLREQLPGYMVPSAFAILESLPLTPNGKVDRAALARRPLPDRAGREGQDAFVPPQSQLEKLVAGIWCEVLGVDRVGLGDDFFDLGGHSLLATRVVSRLRKVLGIEPPLRTLFERPTVAGLAAYVAQTSARHQVLEAPALEPAARRGPPPWQAVPSFAQQRLWFLDRFEPDSTLYNVPNVFHLRGRLDRDALSRALSEIVRRHEALRTRFETVDGEPFQVIETASALPLPVADLDRLGDPERRAEARRLARRDAFRPFDLARGPVLRALLLRLRPDEHSLVLTVHHIAFDGWSVGVLLDELAVLYSGTAAPLPELAVQYADFAAWQRRWLAGEVLESQLAYWRERLAGLPVLELPTDRPRPAMQSFRGSAEVFLVPAELYRRLTQLGRQGGATLFMTLLAAFQGLLGRCCGQEDVAVGFPVANRNQAEIEGLLGFFVNTLVLRGDLRGDPTVREMLARVRDVALDAYAHQDLPFEKLVEELEPERNLSHSPLVQVLLVLQNASPASRELAPGLALSVGSMTTETAKFDLTLGLEEPAKGPEGPLRGVLEYNTDLFDAVTIRRLAGHYRTLLAGITADPARHLAELPLLSEAEGHQLLLEWNMAGAAHPAEASIAELFEAQAAAAPEAVAVVFAGSSPVREVSYAELNRRANRLAHRLRAAGVGPEVCVGLCVERSVEMVVGILGILKAGGAYLPLDPSYPGERLAFMLEDVAAPVLLVGGERLAERLEIPEGSPRRLLLLDGDRAAARHGTENPDSGATAENLAYVMYTSGSTGRPKGVGAVHRGVVRLVREANYAELDARQVFGQLAPIAFDASTLEIWGALVNGGRLVVFPPHAPSLQELGAVLERYAVTTLWLTAGLFHQMVDERPQGLRAIRQLLAGGDVLSAAHLRRALAELGETTVINGYGPTENTTFTCCSPMRRASEVGDPVAIGRPIAGTRVHVLDRRLRPVGIGIPGELLTAGAGLARGYLNRPQPTAERFVPNPFGDTAQRLYRTGDVVRLLADGRIEFLGRRDFQVKVRGFRIELGEVEGALVRHPAVREAVVVAAGAAGGEDRRLVAYLVAAEPAPEVAALRGFLRDRLPGYMVPSAFAVLESLPLTPNGKVDRAALSRRFVPAPDRAEGEGERAFAAPQSPLERIVARIWGEVLGVDRVGLDDNFFELGGHSLLATKVFSRLHESLAVELPLAVIFDAADLGGFVARIEEILSRREGGREVIEFIEIPRRERSGTTRLPLSFSQERLWLLDRLEPGSSAYNLPFPVRLEGELEVAVLEHCLAEIVRRHESLRTTFAFRDARPEQLIAPPSPWRLAVVDLARLAQRGRRVGVEALLHADATSPFDLERGPLYRAHLVRLGPREHVLVQTMHHIISDGWSIGVFLGELVSLLEAAAAGRPISGALPELVIGYADFALWQRERLRGELEERQLGYWRDQLGGELPALELPTDRQRPAFQTHRGAASSRRLPESLSAALHALSRRQRASLFMTLLAAFKVLLHRYTGQEDIIVGAPIAGRQRLEVEGLIGFFLNTLALRTVFAADTPFHELLDRVRRVVLEATAHQEVPFEKLLEELQPERHLSHSPLFQVFFNMINLPEPRLELPGLKIEPLPPSKVESKFDLTLYVTEKDGGIRFDLVYNADLFDQARMFEMLEQYARLLEQIVADPDAAIGACSLVTASAEEILPRPAEPLSDRWEGSIPDGFARRARRFPEHPAVVDPGETWSYGELDRRSNQLARYLLAHGVEPGDAVAVWAHRNASLVWALVGILKAGAAFVILDPAYPAARLGEYVRLARPRGWLEIAGAIAPPAELEARVDALGRCRLSLPSRRVAAAEDFLADQPSDPPGVAVGPDDLAYVAFTSGSTGKPKGILGRHGPLTHFLPWLAETFGLDRQDRHSLLSALSHDPLHRDVFMPLWYGATIAIPDPEKMGTPGYLAAWVRDQALTILNLVPAMLRVLTQESRGKLESLRYAFTVGDVLTRDDAAALYTLSPSVRCVNYYGSTETQRSVSYFVVPRTAGPHELEKAVLPLGRGIRDVELLVLNPAGALAGIGELGEICFRSHHLARGYLGDEALTRERFVPNPFSEIPGDRLYRTGDLGRYLPDGDVEFLGRADQQVKIRGFRIELGEIEAALGRHPGVEECAVTLRGDPGGDRRLVAYLVAAAGVGPDRRELRAYLSRRLPDYMVPSAFVDLEALPLTRTGKLDRRALPEPQAAEAEDGLVPPRDGVQEMLAALWCEVLGLARVGVHDHFFELGGHSLLATQLLSRVRDAFGVELPLRAVFESPTLEAMAGALEAHRAAAGPAPPPLVPGPRDGELPLGFSQQRLWFLDQLEPQSPAYVLSGALRLAGRLEVAALEASFREIVRRHQTLRTRVVTLEGRAEQRISEPGPHALPVVDLSALPAPARRAETLRLAAREARCGFDLARGPLLRTTLLHLAFDEHALLVSMHHIITDGWSIGVLVRELAALYEAGTAGRPSPLPEPVIQYADFARWERDWLQGEVLDALLGYWRDALAGAPPVLELPTDRPRPAMESFRGARRGFELAAPLAAGLRGLSRGLSVTLFMTLAAAFKALLCRHADQDDVVVGTPIAHRRRTELESLIGFFANTLVLRTDLSGAPTFQELCRRVRDVALGAYAHQDMPFERLVDELAPERDLSHSPIFQAMFSLQNAPSSAIRLPGLTLEPLEVETRRAQFDLTLTLVEDGEGLSGWLEYNTDLYDATTAERLVRRYRLLVESAVADPDVLVADPDVLVAEMPLLGLSERRQLEAEWNDTAAAYASERCLHELFEARVERAPEAPAIEFEGGRLSYRELNAESNRLAHHLRALGAGPEVLVGVLTERGPEMVIALLAILKAGAAYLPLDPGYPRERLATMLEDSGAPLVVTHGTLAERLGPPAAAAFRPVRLDAERAVIAARPPENPPPAADPANLAYVIYTSGSTGKPKGVQIAHRPLVNFLESMARQPGLDSDDVLLAVTTISFDIAGLELYLPLVRGGRVVVASRELAADGLALAAALDGGEITQMQATPATWRMLLEAGWTGAPGLEVLCGGEALPAELAARLGARCGSLWNVYGPTETTVWSTVRRVGAELGGSAAAVAIGRPLANTQVHLLDRRFAPVAIGIAGELAIGGQGLSRGYRGRPAPTAERFVPDPFRGQPGARLYRTGDLARRLADGELEFLGRIDHQVKLRGFRIELGEIEAVLSRHPAIARAVVVVREDRPGTLRLAAYIVPVPDAGEPSSGELRSFLAATLPEYMVPTLVVALESLPLTPNGKVDRRALVRRALPEAASERTFEPPVTAEEIALAKIWCEVLELDRVGIHDNFFALGGDSILVIQVVARSKQAGLRFEPRQMFRHQTIAELARVVEMVDGAGAESAPAAPAPLPEAADEALDPAAFPEADLTQEELDDVFAELGIESD